MTKKTEEKTEKTEENRIQKTIDLYKAELSIAGYSQKTIKMYTLYLQKFLEFCKKPAEQCERADVVMFLSWEKEQNKVNNSTLALIHSSLKFYYHKLLKKKILEDIKPAKKGKSLPTVLTKEEIIALLKAVKPGRNRLMIKLLYASGLRVGELVKIKIENLNLKERMGKIEGGKGNKDRIIILSENWCKEIKKYIERKKIKTREVFSKKNGTPLSTDTIQRIMRNAAKKAGIQKHVTPHKLRHSYATHLLEAGENIRKIQELLGHSNLSTTQIYTHVSTKELKKVKSPLDNIKI
ncbi:MAG: site-specific tyrosine recombinase/integron integrase [Candidatus Diapherotrites archaeon]